MINENKLKIVLGIIYLSTVTAFLLIFFNYFSLDDFSSYELIKNNRDKLNDLKNSNLFVVSIFFLIGVIIWVLLLGFGSPILLIGGFIFGKWIGTLLVLFGLSIGATLLYLVANYLFKNLIKEKFSYKFSSLTMKFKKNEFIFFLIYRFVGGIPFFISNILPTLFNVKVKNFFFGSLIGMAPQIFVGVSLGSGLNEVIENNKSLPNFFQILFTPDTYLPIIGIIFLFIIGLFIKKYFYK